MSAVKCQQVLWNLLELFEGKDSSMPASILVGELMQTGRCSGLLDPVVETNLETLRQDYTDALASKEAMHRIKAGEATVQDETKSLQTIAHYRTHTTNILYSGLWFWRKVEYQTLFKAERNLAALGILGIGVGGSRAIFRISQASAAYITRLKK